MPQSPQLQPLHPLPAPHRRNKGDLLNDLDMYVFIASLLLTTCFGVYSEYRKLRSNGVFSDTNLSIWAPTVPSVLYLIYSHSAFYSYGFLIGVVFGIIIVIWFIHYYFIGQVFDVYEIARADVFSTLREELERMSIPYTEKESLNSDEYYFHITEDKTSIKVRWYSEREKKQNVTLTFKKWWRSDPRHGLKLQLLERFRERKGNQHSWKNFLANSLICVGIFLIAVWILLRIS